MSEMSNSIHLANTNASGFPEAPRHTRTWVRFGLVFLAAALVAGFSWQLQRQNEPSYQGRYLSDWLGEVWSFDGGVDPKAENAVRHIGTNAIPYLLSLATTRDSAFKAKVSTILPQRWFANYISRSGHNHFSAGFGFKALGSEAKSAIPALVGLLEDNDEDIRSCAAGALGSIGSDAQDAIPALLKHLNDPSPYVRSGSADALSNIPPRSAQEVPALIQILNGPPKESDVLFLAIERLGQFQSQAKAAVPIILPYLHDQDIATRECAAKALKQIDPEAAAKAGIQ